MLVLLVTIIAAAIAEVAVILQSGRLIGPWLTLALLVATSFLGAWLLRREGSRAWRALVEAFQSGRMPTGELADAALVLVGGVLLMLPGFLSDVVGLFFLLPVTRPLARRLVAAVVGRSVASRGLDLGVLRAKVESDTIIKGETVANPSDPAGPRTVVISGEIDP